MCAISKAPISSRRGLTHDLALRCIEVACRYRLYGPDAYIDKLRKVISIDPVVE